MAFNEEGHTMTRVHDSGLDAVPELVGYETPYPPDDYGAFLSCLDLPTHDTAIMAAPDCSQLRWLLGVPGQKKNYFDASLLPFRPLHELLTRAMREGRSLAGETSHFLPASSLDCFIPPGGLETALCETRVSARLLGDVVNDYRKIFATLAMVSKPSAVMRFIAHGVDDSCLPIPHAILDDTTAIPHDQLTRLHSLFRDLDQETTASFLKWQHTVNPPQILLAYPGAGWGGLHQYFHERTVLPFTHVEQANSGSHGSIFRVRIHPDHRCGTQPLKTAKTGLSYFAIKKLRGPNDWDFVRELNVLRKVSRTPHPSIVPFLGSFQLGRDFHLVFPWADGDLSTFWRLNSKPDMDAEFSAWAVDQWTGLADALAFIHGFQLSSKDTMVHCDLKPANILWFRERIEGHRVNILKIADFGSTFVAAPHWKTVQPDEIPRTTPVYRAPEWDLETRRILPAADIWSLGCIMLEFVTWMTYGSAGLDELAVCRRDTRSDDPSRDAFFSYRENSAGQIDATIKPGVVEWTYTIASTSNFSTDVVNLIREDMLVFLKEDYMFGRLTSVALREALSKMHQDIERNAAYCARRGPLEMVHSRQSTDGGKDGNRKRALLAETSIRVENKAKRKKTDKTDMSEGFSEQDFPKRKFACPYSKAGIDKSILNRACDGPGWVEVHRVKEHIGRCHTPSSFKNPHVCGRCLENFGSQEGLVQHQREETQCIIRAPEIIHGKLTLEQVINLRSTKKKAPNMTDEGKWFEWFSILLPTHPLPSCPYYEDATSSTLNTLSTQNSTGISEYKEYLRIPLDEKKQKALEVDLGDALGISNPALCKILASKFRDYQLRDLQKFDEDKLKPTHEIPGYGDLPTAGKEHDHVSEAGVLGFESYLAEWTGADGVWSVL